MTTCHPPAERASLLAAEARWPPSVMRPRDVEATRASSSEVRSAAPLPSGTKVSSTVTAVIEASARTPRAAVDPASGTTGQRCSVSTE